MTTNRDNFYLPYDVWNARIEKLVQHMVISMVIDVEGKAPRQGDGNRKTLADRGREDLENFHNWSIFAKARDCGIYVPSVSQVKSYLKNGIATERKAIYVTTDSTDRADSRKRGHPSHKKVPVGSIRIRGAGSEYVKTAQPDVWELVPKKEGETVGKPAA